MSVLSAPYFHDEKAAIKHLESIVWPTGPVCPHCGGFGKIYELNGKKDRPGLKKCGQCRKKFTVKVGTVYEASHIPVRKWLQATYLLAASKKGLSAHQLHRMIGVTYKSAWFMMHRIRESMKPSGTSSPIGGEGKTVEADETYFSTRPMFRNSGIRGFHTKMKVVSLVERGGKARSIQVEDVHASVLRKILAEHVHAGSHLMTDAAPLYKNIGKNYASHESVNHHLHEYGRGDVHTNTIEGFFSIFKRGMKGVYQHCGEQHLQRYLAEFDFRYSHREGLGTDDAARAAIALKGIQGKRLTYQRPHINEAA